MTQVTWLGRDLAALGLVSGIPAERAAVVTGGLVAPEYEIRLTNKDRSFSGASGLSMLAGVEWRGSRIKVVRDGETVVDGYVMDGTPEQAQFVLKVQSVLARYFRKECDLELEYTDPAAAALALLQAAGIPAEFIDAASFGRASGIYQAGGVSIAVLVAKEYHVKLVDALNALLEMGSASCWLDDQIHFAAYEPLAAVPLYHVRPSDMADVPQISANGTDRVYNDYSLSYLADGGVPAVDADGEGYGIVTQGLYEVRCWQQDYGSTSKYQIDNVATAHFLGGLRMLRDRYAKKTLSFRIRLDRLSLPLGLPLLVTYEDWSAKPFRLVTRERSTMTAVVELEEVL